MTCDGVTCKRYKADKPVSGGRYASGQKRCQTCEIYIWWSGVFCPCCNTRLRGKPRNMQYKEGYFEQIKENGLPTGNIIDSCKLSESEENIREKMAKDADEI